MSTGSYPHTYLFDHVGILPNNKFGTFYYLFENYATDSLSSVKLFWYAKVDILLNFFCFDTSVSLKVSKSLSLFPIYAFRVP